MRDNFMANIRSIETELNSLEQHRQLMEAHLAELITTPQLVSCLC